MAHSPGSNNKQQTTTKKIVNKTDTISSSFSSCCCGILSFSLEKSQPEIKDLLTLVCVCLFLLLLLFFFSFESFLRINNEWKGLFSMVGRSRSVCPGYQLARSICHEEFFFFFFFFFSSLHTTRHSVCVCVCVCLTGLMYSTDSLGLVGWIVCLFLYFFLCSNARCKRRDKRIREKL